MTPVMYLSESDRAVLQKTINQVLRRPINSNPFEATDQYHTQDVYVAKLPDNGIPGLCVGKTDVPGSATCEIYKLTAFNRPGTGTGSVFGIVLGTGSGTGTCIDPDIDQYYLESIGIEREIFNVYPQDINSKYIVVRRDKYGYWLADPPSTLHLRGTLVQNMRPEHRAIFSVGTSDPQVYSRETGTSYYLDSAANPDKHAAFSGAKVNMVYDAIEGEWCVDSVERTVECIPTGDFRVVNQSENGCEIPGRGTGSNTPGTGSCDPMSEGNDYPANTWALLEEKVKELSVETAEEFGIWRASGVRFMPVQNVVGFYDEDYCTIIQTQVQYVPVACDIQEAIGPCGEICDTGTGTGTLGQISP